MGRHSNLEQRRDDLQRLMMQVIIVWTLCCFGALVAGTPHITHFELINTNTGLPIRRMGNHEVISLAVPFNIVAKIGGQGNVSKVTFVEPFDRVELSPPYALAGDRPKRMFSAVSLNPGYYCLSAYVNDDIAAKKMLLFWVSDRYNGSSVIPEVGPLPTAIEPSLGSYAAETAIPPQSAGCNRTDISARIADLKRVEGRDDAVEMLVGVDWCTEADDYVRVRVMRYAASIGADRKRAASSQVLNQTNVKAADLQIPMIMHPFWLVKICTEQLVFVEVCVYSIANGNLCYTTPFRFVGRLPAKAPRLTQRPPIDLMLAPGDAVRILYELADSDGSEGFSNGGYDVTDRIFTVWALHEQVDGSLQMTQRENTTSLAVNVPFSGSGVSLSDNASIVYMKYDSLRCAESGSWKPLYGTRILVDSSYKSLVQQDTELPIFDQPVYPPTPYRQSVEIEVLASNPGGGMREGEQPTELYYQWYVRTEDDREKKTYAEAIEGENGPVLKILSAVCHVDICDVLFGCSSYHLYFVDVCNTFGCRRSDAIVPQILPPIVMPDGMVWNGTRCAVEPGPA